MRRYESLVAGTVIGMLGNIADAEDIGQETFIRFYKNLRKFRGESAVGTYLTRIAINLSINELKKRSRRFKLFRFDKEDQETEIADPRAEIQHGEDRDVIQKALLELDPKLRSVVVLRLVDGYSTRETAQILGIPIGTVLSRLSRGQRQLKTLLSPYLEESV